MFLQKLSRQQIQQACKAGMHMVTRGSRNKSCRNANITHTMDFVTDPPNAIRHEGSTALSLIKRNSCEASLSVKRRYPCSTSQRPSSSALVFPPEFFMPMMQIRDHFHPKRRRISLQYCIDRRLHVFESLARQAPRAEMFCTCARLGKSVFTKTAWR